MKIMTINEFLTFVSHPNWIREKNICRDEFDDIRGDSELLSSLDGVEIRFSEAWFFCPVTRKIDTRESDYEPWIISGLTVLDENNVKVDVCDLIKHLASSFSEIEYTEIEVEILEEFGFSS